MILPSQRIGRQAAKGERHSSADDVRCLQVANAILGEGPTWDCETQSLFWVDIKRPAVFRFELTFGQTGFWLLDHPVGCAFSTDHDQLLIVDSLGLALLAPDSGEFTRVQEIGDTGAANRFNDGKIDRAGRLWVGTVADPSFEPVGSLYKVGPDLEFECMEDGLGCSNGIGWSPDNKTMYLVDSAIRTIWAYDFDLGRGAIANRRCFAQFDSIHGDPDGLTVDAEGHLWVANWDGNRIIRFSPDGMVVREITLPVRRPTSCVFGGLDLQTLIVTSASLNLDAEALQEGPLAGGLFAIHVDVPGIPETRFAVGRS